jgi:hypothetical protein
MVSPGRARNKLLKPLRREGRTASAEPVCSCAFFYLPLHMRPRVQRAPGLPCVPLGIARRPLFEGRLCPLSFGAKRICKTRADDVARSRRDVSALPFPPSSSANDPVFRGVSDGTCSPSNDPATPPSKISRTHRRNPDASARVGDGFRQCRRPPTGCGVRRGFAAHHCRDTECKNLRRRSVRS